MSECYECSINGNSGYYLKENKLEKYKSRSTNTWCGPLGLEVSWSLEGVLEYDKRANVNLVMRKGKKENLGNCRPVNLTSVHGKIVQQLILETCFQTREGQEDEQRAMDGVYLDFSKDFDIVFHDTIIEKLTSMGREVRCIQNWLNGQAQHFRAVIRAHRSFGSISFWEPQGSVLESLLWNIFTEVLHSGVEFAPSKFAADKKWGERDVAPAHTLHVCAAMQRNLDRLENWTEDPHEEKGKCKILYLNVFSLNLLSLISSSDSDGVLDSDISFRDEIDSLRYP
ncbi:hypothetical protein BTVI_06513 [Pitangus sulphuratus]|nr:hypothetical protein BTVI_06513 [Pitangus sulphuratus]